MVILSKVQKCSTLYYTCEDLIISYHPLKQQAVIHLYKVGQEHKVMSWCLCIKDKLSVNRDSLPQWLPFLDGGSRSDDPQNTIQNKKRTELKSSTLANISVHESEPKGITHSTINGTKRAELTYIKTSSHGDVGGGSIMIWPCFAASGPKPPVIIERKINFPSLPKYPAGLCLSIS